MFIVADLVSLKYDAKPNLNERLNKCFIELFNKFIYVSCRHFTLNLVTGRYTENNFR